MKTEPNKENFACVMNGYGSNLLFEKARERCRVCIDVGSDNVADQIKLGSNIKLTRD